MNADELTKHFFKSEKLRLVYTGILADFCADPSEVIGLSTVFTNFETAFDENRRQEQSGRPHENQRCCCTCPANFAQ